MLKENTSRDYVVGIDPGTGKDSGAGIAVLNFKTRELILAKSLWCTVGKKVPAWKRIQDVSLQVGEHLRTLQDIISVLYIESFVMRGKGGETLARFVGSVLPVMPLPFDFKEVANTRVKLHVTGRGDADKEAVAAAVHEYFSHSPESMDIIEELIIAEDFDALDAVAIAIAGTVEHGQQA